MMIGQFILFLSTIWYGEYISNRIVVHFLRFVCFIFIFVGDRFSYVAQVGSKLQYLWFCLPNAGAVDINIILWNFELLCEDFGVICDMLKAI